MKHLDTDGHDILHSQDIKTTYVMKWVFVCVSMLYRKSLFPQKFSGKYYCCSNKSTPMFSLQNYCKDFVEAINKLTY